MTVIKDKNTWRNRITRKGSQAAREFICEDCDLKIAEMENGEVSVFCHSDDPAHALKIPLEQILAAAASDPKSRQILMAFYIENDKLKIF